MGQKKGLRDVDKESKNADKSLGGFGKAALSAGAAVAKTGAAVGAAAAALGAMVVTLAKSQKEMRTFASTANVTAARMEELSFAFSTVGIDASGTAQLLNDVTEAASEFANVASGPFQDFADQMGLSKEQAQELALEIKDLSGDQAMLRLVRASQDAGLSISDTNQALKAISGDFQFLTPLIADNAKEMERLSERYAEANSQLELTTGQRDDLDELAETWSLLTGQLGNSATLISSSLAPVMNDFFNDVIRVVPEATNTIIDFINAFRSPEEIQSLKEINSQIESQERNLSKLNEQLAETKNQKISILGVEIDNTRAVEVYNQRIEEETERLSELQSRQQELIEQQGLLEEIEGREGGLIGGVSASNSDEDITDKKREIWQKYHEDREAMAQKMFDNIESLNQTIAENEKERIENLFSDQGKIDKANAKSVEDSNKMKEKSNQVYFKSAKQIGNALFEDNKAWKIGTVIVDTAAGVMKAFSSLPPPASFAAAAGIAATGVAQLSAIQSASKGGGSVASAGTSIPTAAPTPMEETASNLTFTQADASGANIAVTLKIDPDSSDSEIGAMLAKVIKVSEQDGVTAL